MKTRTNVLALLVLLLLSLVSCDSASKHLSIAKKFDSEERYDQALKQYNYIVRRYPQSNEAAEARRRIREIDRIRLEKLKVAAQVEAERLELEREKKAKELEEHKARGKELSRHIESKYDEMEGITWYYAKGSKGVPNWWYDTWRYRNWRVRDRNYAYAVYAYIGQRDSKPWLRFKCWTQGYSWLFLQKVLFLIDKSERFEILATYSNTERNVIGDGYVSEEIDTRVGNTMRIELGKIALGTEVKVRFSGERDNADFVLTNKEKKDLLTILNYYTWLGFGDQASMK